MNIFLNSKPTEIDQATTVAKLIQQQELPVTGTAVAVNNKVIPRNLWDSTLLDEGCKVTVIRAVCGG